MLFINFLGLIAMLTSVSGFCDFGTSKLTDFDWNKISGSGTWYMFYYNPNIVLNNLDCLVGVISSPEGNRSLIITKAFDISGKHNITNYGYATNWKRNGYFEMYHQLSLWNGQGCVVAVDYNRYVIIKFCTSIVSEPYVYVAVRNNQPDKDTMKDLLKDLQDNNIEVNQLKMSSANHCQEV